MALSSAASTRRVEMSGRSPVSGSGGAGSRASPSQTSGRRTSKTVPLPTSLRTVIPPPMSSAIWRQMVRPSPVPPNRRVVVLSACTKGSNRVERASGDTPMPVSATERVRTLARAGTGASTVRETSPSLVNFRALETRLPISWRTRTGSPRQIPRASSRTSRTRLRPLAEATGSKVSKTSPAISVMSKGMSSRSSRPASIFDTSRMSSTILSRLAPDFWMTSSRSR